MHFIENNLMMRFDVGVVNLDRYNRIVEERAQHGVEIISCSIIFYENLLVKFSRLFFMFDGILEHLRSVKILF